MIELDKAVLDLKELKETLKEMGASLWHRLTRTNFRRIRESYAGTKFLGWY